MPKVFTSKTQKIGEIGENLAVKFLMKHNYTVIERNYTKKWGEIDIIAKKDNKIHFIEVKSVSRATLKDLDSKHIDNYRPEDNMHPWKLQRLSRTIQTYLLTEKVPDDTEWQVDLVIVFIVDSEKKAKIKLVKDIIL